MNLPLDLSEDLLKNKVIIVEDTETTPGRSIVLAQALNVPAVTMIATEFSPFTDWTEVKNDGTVGHLLEKLKASKGNSAAVLLYSLTPVMFDNNLQTVVQFLSEHFYFIFITKTTFIFFGFVSTPVPNILSCLQIDSPQHF